MDYIMIERVAFSKLIEKIKSIQALAQKIEDKKSIPGWLDNQEVCQVLGISPRTLQTLRDKKVFGRSRKDNKFHYKRSVIERFLKSNYIKGKK